MTDPMGRWLSLMLLLSCGGTPASEAPATVVELPIEVVDSEPAPRPEPGKADPLAPLRKRFAELSDFDAVPKPDHDKWLEPLERRPLWLRVNGSCVEMSRDADDDAWSADVEVCAELDGATWTRCLVPVELGGQGLAAASVWHCTITQPGGVAGGGRGGGSSDSPFPALELLHVNKRGAVFARQRVAQAWVRSLTRYRAPCLDGTIERAFGDYAASHPQMGVDGVARALRRSHGISKDDDRRACDAGKGVSLRMLDAHRRRGAFGAGVLVHNLDQPVDCSKPCPSDPHAEEALAINEMLSAYRFVKRTEKLRAEVHLDEASCNASKASGWQLQQPSYCAKP